MGQIKPWQIAVIVAAVLAVAAAAYWTISGNDMPKMSHRVVLVDITTGELFEASTARKSAIIPEKNPTSGTYTLFPVAKGADGVWKVPPRYLESMEKDTKATALVSAKSGEVKVTSESPKSITLGK
ncbi:MAG: hypothetical protein AABZ53_15145 [Planctomycetota bacterium]